MSDGLIGACIEWTLPHVYIVLISSIDPLHHGIRLAEVPHRNHVDEHLVGI